MPLAVIIGVNHNDPLGPRKVEAQLSIIKRKGFYPEYVCVEWKKEIAEAVIKKRKQYGNKVRNAFSNLTESDIAEFEKSLAFEADSHIPFFQNATVVWLDEARDVETATSAIEDFDKDRITIYTSYCSQNATIQEISNCMLSIAGDYNPSSRDADFFQAVKDATNCSCDILCIVGAGHSRTELEGSFAYLLKAAGYTISVFDTAK